MFQDGKLTMVNQYGEEKECQIILTFFCKETNKDYVVFTDNSFDEMGQIRVFVNTYDPTGKDLGLGEVESPEEMAMVQKILTSLTTQEYDEEEN